MNAIKVVSKVSFEIQVWDGIKWPALFDVAECISSGSINVCLSKVIKKCHWKEMAWLAIWPLKGNCHF